MALKPFNSVGGFSVGESANTVIDSNSNITANAMQLFNSKKRVAPCIIKANELRYQSRYRRLAQNISSRR